PGRERGSLVQKKQFGIPMRREHRAMAVLEAQRADQPALEPPGRNDALRFVVQYAAIAEPRAACRHRMQMSVRVDSVLKRHGSPDVSAGGDNRLVTLPPAAAC